MALRVRVVSLAFSAGAVDAIVFLTLFGIFTTHLSGDTTKLAIDVGRGNHIWIGYLAGGIAGTALELNWEFWSLSLPLAVLATVFVDELRNSATRTRRRRRVLGVPNRARSLCTRR